MKAEAGDVVLTLKHDEAVRLKVVLYGAYQHMASYPLREQPDLKELHDALAAALDRKARP